jgi:ABC-2 type transport system ATP-binding protein
MSPEASVIEPIVSVEHLEKRFGDVVAVRDVSFDVRAGEVFGILGPNGSGKTTTVECLQGLRSIDGGTARVLGFDPTTEAGELRHHIGAQLQESALPDRMRVWEALRLFSSLAPGGPPWEDVLEQWGLTDKRNAAFASLSGGQQQRLFIALALVNAPELVFLDEMTTGLDPASRRLAWDLIDRVRQQGTTVVLVTHFMDEAEHLCDRLVVIDDARVVAAGTPAELIAAVRPATRVTFTAPPPPGTATGAGTGTGTGDAGLDFLHAVPGVREVTRTGRRYTVSGTGPLLAHVGAALVAHGIAPEDLDVHRPTLEDVYLELTGGTR